MFGTFLVGGFVKTALAGDLFRNLIKTRFTVSDRYHLCMKKEVTQYFWKEIVSAPDDKQFTIKYNKDLAQTGI